MNDRYVLHLNLSRCSGRAVRYRELTIPEIDAAAIKAHASIEGADASQIQYNTAVTRAGIMMMIEAISRDPLPDGFDVEKDHDKIDWVSVSYERLTMDESWRYEKLFRAKDEILLREAYMQLHAVMQGEANELVGKSMKPAKTSSASNSTKQPAGTASPTSAGTAASG